MYYPGADETISLVSDTWSTDVLASDSEMLEQPPMPEPPVSTLPGSQVNKLMSQFNKYTISDLNR